MSMAEIQEAAEIITSAVSPDANIIFGATLKPELEDELIITVIATGFDNAYYQQQAEELSASVEQTPTEMAAQPISEAVDDIDMDLSNQSAAAQFASENTTDIWGNSVEDDDEDDTPAFLRRRRKNKYNED
jgi:Cell division GTPase